VDQIAKVIALDGKSAVLELERNSACDKCGICHMGTSKKMQLVAENGINAQVGQRVLVEMGERSVLKAGFIIYLLPLLALLVGIGLVYLLDGILEFSGAPDWWAIGVGLVFFALTYVVIRLQEPARQRREEYNLEIVRVMEEHEEITDICGHKDDE